MARFRTAAVVVASALVLLGLTPPSAPVAHTPPRNSRYEFRDAAYGSSATAAPMAAFGALGSSRDYSLLFPAQTGAPYARWNPCKPIYWRVNPRWAPEGALADLQGAFTRLHAATGLTFVYRGTTTLVPGTAAYDAADTDGYIIVAWAPDGSTTLIPRAPRGRYGLMGMAGGYATTGYASNGKPYATIDKAYVLLSTSFPSLAGGFGWGNRYGWLGTRGMLDMHELAHAVGLDHARGTTQIMYPVAQRMPANWGAGDLTGLRLVGRAAGCIPAFTG
ncbi:MAG TPA: hypothetical protein VFP73_04250 [Terrabacter sp.]|nr:hypothetical protein [Terrabacter sp.]